MKTAEMIFIALLTFGVAGVALGAPFLQSLLPDRLRERSRRWGRLAGAAVLTLAGVYLTFHARAAPNRLQFARSFGEALLGAAMMGQVIADRSRKAPAA